MEYTQNNNAVWGLISQLETSDPPYYWYFGTFQDADYESCGLMCLSESGCQAIALHLEDFPEDIATQCYGRGSQDVMVAEELMLSGVKHCMEEYQEDAQPLGIIELD